MSILHQLVSEPRLMAETHRGRGRVCRRGRGVDAREDEPPNLRRDQRDREITARRRRIRELERQLVEARTATANEEREEESASLGSSSTSDDDEGFNRWGIPNQRIRRPGVKPDISYQTLGMKIDLLEFEGISHPDEFIDWLRTVERVFDVKNLNDGQKIKLVAIKLRKHASIWWEHVKTKRVREGKPEIRSWSKMKKKLIARFLPTQYRQEAFVECHNLKQRGMSVEQYANEFDMLRMRCDVVEEDVAPVYDDYEDYDEGLGDHLTEGEEITCADSGESSVLESLAGISLPRGRGICTRVPLVMRLQNDPNITAPHLQLEYNNKSLPVEEVGIAEAIIPATDEIAGHVAVQGQPEDISTVDFPTCESIRMSQKVDRTGERTLAVVNFSVRCNVPGLVSELIKCGKMKGIMVEDPFEVFEESPQVGRAPPLVRVEKMFEQIQSKRCLSEDVQRGFAQEIYIWRKVRHKNVVLFVGTRTKPPCLCIITEFMSGGSLYDFLHHGHLKVYQWSASDWDDVSDILETYGQNCWYPVVCGRYNICTNNGQCTCPPQVNFFRPFSERKPDLGCSQLTSSNCNSSHYHSFVELKNEVRKTALGFSDVPMDVELDLKEVLMNVSDEKEEEEEHRKMECDPAADGKLSNGVEVQGFVEKGSLVSNVCDVKGIDEKFTVVYAEEDSKFVNKNKDDQRDTKGVWLMKLNGDKEDCIIRKRKYSDGKMSISYDEEHLKIDDGNGDVHDGTDEIGLTKLSGNEEDGITRKRKRKSSLYMLQWITELAKDPCDPAIGHLPEKSKWKSYGNEVVWKKILLLRDEALLERNVDTSTQYSIWQQKQKMHPSMYDDNSGFERLRCSQRVLSAKDSSKNSGSDVSGTLIDGLTDSSAESGVWSNSRCKKIASIGLEFQADIPEWKKDIYESDAKWLGIRIWPLDKNEQRRILTERDPTGKGRVDTCGCEYPGSFDCIRFHLSEKRRKLKLELASTFYHWKFDCMGEKVALSWTRKDEKNFHDIAKSRPLSRDESFSYWPELFKFFPHKSRESLVSYYFNVFLLRRIGHQSRMNASDDDE